jgi:ribonuclease HI
MIELYFDGACEPFNPGGTVSCGFVIKKDGKVIVQGSKIIGKGDDMTNNVGEYHGLIEGIKAFARLNIEEKLVIYGDSKMVCNMVSKKWGWNKKKTKWIPHEDAPHLKDLLKESVSILEGIKHEVVWVPREDNQEADVLSKEPLMSIGIINRENESQKKLCPICGGFLKRRSGRFGDFYGCSNYPKCNFTKKINRNEEVTKDIVKPKIKKKHQLGDVCPKNCGGTLCWANRKITEKRLKNAYHYEKWLKCNKCKAVFFDEKYKIIHK